MLWPIWLAALLPFAIATEQVADPVAIKVREADKPHRHLSHLEQHKEHKRHKEHKEREEHKEDKKGHQSLKRVNLDHLEEQDRRSTAWHRRDYSGNWYVELIIMHHNYHRSVHGAGEITWSNELAETAQEVAQSCVYAHNTEVDPSAGQNIAAGLPPDNITGVVTELWYNAEVPYFAPNYGQPQPSYEYFENWGHLTQIVWKGTTQVGCATQYCPQGLGNTGGYIEPYFTVCNYLPAGNVEDEYADNVGSPEPAQTLHWYNY